MKGIFKGEVVKLTANGKPFLALDIPPKHGVALPIEGILVLNEIFTPYLGKTITIRIDEDQKGKVKRITIVEEK